MGMYGNSSTATFCDLNMDFYCPVFSFGSQANVPVSSFHVTIWSVSGPGAAENLKQENRKGQINFSTKAALWTGQQHSKLLEPE